MSRHNTKASDPGRISKGCKGLTSRQSVIKEISPGGTKPKLEIVLKCDSPGSLEAVEAGIFKIPQQAADIDIIHSGVGAIGKSDIMIAETGSRLIAGFQTAVIPGIERELKECSVEVRLYEVIYALTSDISSIAERMVPAVSREQTLGTAGVIALFKSSRKGVIAGCEVFDGYLAIGRHFRIISAAGPVYSGIIESMQQERSPLKKALPGQQVGIKIRDFNKVKIGDIIESFTPSILKKTALWQPKGEIVRIS